MILAALERKLWPFVKQTFVYFPFRHPFFPVYMIFAHKKPSRLNDMCFIGLPIPENIYLDTKIMILAPLERKLWPFVKLKAAILENGRHF